MRKGRTETIEQGALRLLGEIQDLPGHLNKRMNPRYLGSDDHELTLELEFVVEQWQLNHNFVMHGGAMAAAFDETLGTLARWAAAPMTAVTSHLATAFLKPVHHHSRITVRAKILSMGKRLITVSGEAYADTPNNLVGSAMASYVPLPVPSRPEAEQKDTEASL